MSVAGRSTPPPRSTRTRPPGIATLAEAMIRSPDVASAVPMRRFFFPERDVASEGGYATTVKMLDWTESTTPRRDPSSERKALVRGTADAMPGVTIGATVASTKSDTAAASGPAAKGGVVGLRLEDDVHVIGGSARDRGDARGSGSAVAAIEVELVGDVLVDVARAGIRDLASPREPLSRRLTRGRGQVRRLL